MLKPPVIATPSAVELEPEPIPAGWVLSGSPDAHSKILGRSRDWASHVVVWECAPGKFHWHYSTDEVLLVVSGEAFLIGENGDERRFGPGDVASFPAGFSCTWRVTERIRKVAVLRETMWLPLGFCLKSWKKFRRMTGLSRKPSFKLG